MNSKSHIVLLLTTFFWKFYFSLWTSYKELIWCSNAPDVNISIFCRHWSCTWRFFFPVSVIKHNNLQRLIFSRNNYFRSKPFFNSCYFNKIFVYLSVIAAACHFSVYNNFTEWDPANILAIILTSIYSQNNTVLLVSSFEMKIKKNVAKSNAEPSSDV